MSFALVIFKPRRETGYRDRHDLNSLPNMLTFAIHMVISSLFVQALAFNNKPFLQDLYDNLYNFYLKKSIAATRIRQNL